MKNHKTGFWIGVASRVLLVGLLLFGTFSGAQQFEGKAFAGRLITYPLIGLLVFVIWVIRKRPQPYPYAADNLLIAPFLIDVLGNALDLYDTIWWWDDANHFVNWALLCGAFGLLLRRTRLKRLPVFSLVVGFGAIVAIMWELSEYVTFLRDSPELQTAYTDTLGDLSLGLCGSVAAGFLTCFVAWKSKQEISVPDSLS